MTTNYSGRVIDIDDTITFHGTSVAEFDAAFKTAIECYIQAYEQVGQRGRRQIHQRKAYAKCESVSACAVTVKAQRAKWAELEQVGREGVGRGGPRLKTTAPLQAQAAIAGASLHPPGRFDI